MNRTPATARTSIRIAAFFLSLATTLATLQSIDALASRDHGETFAARAAGQVAAGATALRQAARRG